LAREAGLDQSHIAVVEDGESVELDAETMERGEKIGTGLVYVDGLGVGDVEQIVLRDRRHLAEDGILVVTLTLDRGTGAVRAMPRRSWPVRSLLRVLRIRDGAGGEAPAVVAAVVPGRASACCARPRVRNRASPGAPLGTNRAGSALRWSRMVVP